MLAAFATLLCCQLAGETLVRATDVSIPGPVAGMVLLALLLTVRAPLPAVLGDTANGLLQHLSLLFVPAGVGVVQHLDRLAGEGLRLTAVLLLSTVLTLAVTALVFAGVAWLMNGRRATSEPPEAP